MGKVDKDLEAFQVLQDDALDISDKISDLISLVKKVGESKSKIYNVAFIYNNKMCDVYNYIQDKGFHFSELLLSKAINNYFISLLNMCLLYLSKYFKLFLEDKHNNNYESRIKYLNKYLEICDSIYNFSIERDAFEVVEKNKNLFQQHGIKVDIDDFCNEMFAELDELNIKQIKSDDKPSTINDDYNFSDIQEELEMYKKLNSKK